MEPAVAVLFCIVQAAGIVVAPGLAELAWKLGNLVAADLLVVHLEKIPHRNIDLLIIL